MYSKTYATEFPDLYKYFPSPDDTPTPSPVERPNDSWDDGTAILE